MNNFTLALLPAFNYYRELSVKADLYAVRLLSQVNDSNDGFRDTGKFVLLDGYIDKNIAQKYNEKAVSESLLHPIDAQGDCSVYKGLSLVDIDHAAVFCSVFLHCYREGLAFLSLIGQFKPSKVFISCDDPNLDIFSGLARQAQVETEIITSFGTIDSVKTELIRRSNRALDIQGYDWYRLKKQPIWKRAMTAALNRWSALVRAIRGKKPFIYIIHHGQLSAMRAQLSAQREYYPIFFSLLKLPLRNLLTSGLFILEKQYKSSVNKELAVVLNKYRERLEAIRSGRDIGFIEFNGKEYTVSGPIVSRLLRRVSCAFGRIAYNIDICERFLKKNNVAGALLSSDMNWDRRVIVRLFQKYKLGNMVLMNGWFGVKHMIENKSVDKVLCFAQSYVNDYFQGRKGVKIVGSPAFDAAYAKRDRLKCPAYPVKKILVSTFTFSPDDINGRYSDTEVFIADVLSAIQRYEKDKGLSLRVDIRPHPSEIPEFYQMLLERRGYSGIGVISKGGFQDVVPGYDLFFASYSTTLFEAAAMGIPVIYYQPCNQVLYPPFDGKNTDLPAAFSAKELESVFARAMKDKEYAYRFTRKEAIGPFVGELDGNSTGRIINEVIGMVN